MSRTKIIVLPNDRYGRLTVIKELESKHLRGNTWLRIFKFKCDCGKKHIADLISVRAKE